MSKFVIGVDGGATKSHIAVLDETGKSTAFIEYGALNHEVMEGSYSELEKRLGEAIGQALYKCGASGPDIAYAVLGLAGVDSKQQQTLISDMVRKTGLRDFLVCNDAILGVPAGCPGCVGVCAINGTGFKLAAIDKSGTVRDTCGLGDYTDDKGGGTWYGARACGEVYNALYRLGQPTKMRDMLFNLLGISDKSQYMDAISEIMLGQSPLYNSAELNGIVFTAAALGDAVALGILDESAKQYGQAIARLAMDMDFPCTDTLHVTLAGSVFVKQKVTLLHDMVKGYVEEILGDRDVSYTVLDTPPVTGAVLLAAKHAGFDMHFADKR